MGMEVRESSGNRTGRHLAARSASAALVRQPARQFLSQRAQRLPHLRLDRLYRDPELPRDLRVLEPMNATQLEDFATSIGQRLHRLLHRDAELFLHEIGISTAAVDAASLYTNQFTGSDEPPKR